MKCSWCIVVAVAIVGCAADDSEAEGPIRSTAPESTSVPSSSSTFVPSSSSTPPTEVPVTSMSLVHDFSRDGLDGWYVQNDTVMGGVSSSSVEIERGELVFSGNLSLENNGGFASVRGPILDPGSTTAGDALIIDATGDGRTYLVQILTTTDSYVTRFVPTDGSATLPFTEFTSTGWRLDPVPAVAPLEAASIAQIAIYVLDEQVGEFVLRVRSISIVDS